MKTTPSTLQAGALIIALGLLANLSAASIGYSAGKNTKNGPKRSGKVYLFRGTGGVFSQGLNNIAKKFIQKGLSTRVLGHQAWQEISKEIIHQSNKRQIQFPIILMGHSAGGRAALNVARVLSKKRISVRYLVTFDPNTRASVSSNVRKADNFYLPNKTNTNILLKGRGYRGQLRNINVANIPGMTHLNIDENKKLHARVIRTSLSFTRTQSIR